MRSRQLLPFPSSDPDSRVRLAELLVTVGNQILAGRALNASVELEFEPVDLPEIRFESTPLVYRVPGDDRIVVNLAVTFPADVLPRLRIAPAADGTGRTHP